MLDAAAEVSVPGRRSLRPRRFLRPVAKLRPGFGLLAMGPLFAFLSVFLIVPIVWLVIEAFSGDKGASVQSIRQIFQSQYLIAFKNTFLVSAVTAISSGILGGLVAYAVVHPRAPRFIRGPVITFSAVAAYSGGVPLAFAFIATIGNQGLLTHWLASAGINIYGAGFSLFGLVGLAIVYHYFGISLMVLLLAPAIEGLRAEWREAAENLGAHSWQYWRFVGLPVLRPAFLAAVLLCFGVCFSAYATPYALTSGQIDLVPVLIGVLTTGEVGSNPHLAAALGFGSMVVLMFTMGAYLILQRRVSRFLR